MQERHRKLVMLEFVVWSIILIGTIIAVSFLPWKLAELVLAIIIFLAGTAAVTFYLSVRKLYAMSHEENERIIHAHHQLRGEHEIFHMIFNHAPDGIFVVDGEKRIIEFSPLMEKITGYDKDEVLGRLLLNALKIKAKGKNELLSDVIFEKNDDKPVTNTLKTKDGAEIEFEAKHLTINQDKALIITRFR